MKTQIIKYLENHLGLKNIDLKDNIIELLIKSEANRKNISIEEETQFQKQKHLIDGIFYPVDLLLIGLLMDIEKEFDIIINDHEVEDLNIIQELIENIESKL